MVGKVTRTLQERFMEKFDIVNGHWIWNGATRRGYGVIYVDGRNVAAHRVSVELFSELPAEAEVRHLCQIKLCVNPDCLVPGTHLENMEMERKTYCKNGHEIAIVGRTQSGNCKRCMQEYLTAYHRVKAILGDKK